MKEIIIMNIIAILVVSLLSLICRAIEIKTVEKKAAHLHREVSEHEAAITMSGGWKPKPENIIVREVSGALYADSDIYEMHEFRVCCDDYVSNSVIGTYKTRAEAEAARLQFIHDHCEPKGEDFEL